ncbi:MAG: hypothetical protein FWG47_00475 [Propionibacteriaceae bacterium]|nr:hypothetical protein [Propionibacteriaceae bacterium]
MNDAEHSLSGGNDGEELDGDAAELMPAPITGDEAIDKVLADLDLSQSVETHLEQYAKVLDVLQQSLKRDDFE